MPFSHQVDRAAGRAFPAFGRSRYAWSVPGHRTTNPKYVAILAVASGLILLGGWLIRPEPTANQPAPIPSESELARLARLSQRRSLENTTACFSDVADDVQRALVHVPTVGATGIVWDAGFIITGRLDARVPEALMVSTSNCRSEWRSGGAA